MQRGNTMIATLEGIIENGQIRLKDNVSLPNKTKVYVIIPDIETTPIAQIKSPRLANPQDYGDFTKQVFETTKEEAKIHYSKIAVQVLIC